MRPVLRRRGGPLQGRDDRTQLVALHAQKGDRKLKKDWGDLQRLDLFHNKCEQEA